MVGDMRDESDGILKGGIQDVQKSSQMDHKRTWGGAKVVTTHTSWAGDT